MNFIAIVGPHGSGKDTIIKKVFERFNSEEPGILKRALFTLTRAPRNGEVPNEDHYFVSKEEFMKKAAKGEINYYEPVADYFAGTMVSELRKGQNTIGNITLSGIERNSNIFNQPGDRILKVYLTSPLEQRKRRILERTKNLSKEALDFKINSDLSANLDEKAFDLVIENLDGELEKAVEAVYGAIKKFINT